MMMSKLKKFTKERKIHKRAKIITKSRLAVEGKKHTTEDNKLMKESDKHNKEDIYEQEDDLECQFEKPLFFIENKLSEYKRMKLGCNSIHYGMYNLTCMNDKLTINAWFTNFSITFPAPVISTEKELCGLHTKSVKYENVVLKNSDIWKSYCYFRKTQLFLIIYLSQSSAMKRTKKCFQHGDIILMANTINANQHSYLLETFPGREKIIDLNEELAKRAVNVIGNKIFVTERLISFPVNPMHIASEKKKKNLMEPECLHRLQTTFSETPQLNSDSSKMCAVKKPCIPSANVSAKPMLISSDLYSCLVNNITYFEKLLPQMEQRSEIPWTFILQNRNIDAKTIQMYENFERTVTKYTAYILNLSDLRAHLDFQQKMSERIHVNKSKSRSQDTESINKDQLNQPSDYDTLIRKINHLISSWNTLIKKIAESEKFINAAILFACIRSRVEDISKNISEKYKELELAHTSALHSQKLENQEFVKSVRLYFEEFQQQINGVQQLIEKLLQKENVFSGIAFLVFNQLKSRFQMLAGYQLNMVEPCQYHAKEATFNVAHTCHRQVTKKAEDNIIETESPNPLDEEITSMEFACQCIKVEENSGKCQINPTPPNENILVLFSKECVSFPVNSMDVSERVVIKTCEIKDIKMHSSEEPFVIFIVAAEGLLKVLFSLNSAPSEKQRNCLLHIFSPVIEEVNCATSVELISQFSTQMTVPAVENLALNYESNRQKNLLPSPQEDAAVTIEILETYFSRKPIYKIRLPSLGETKLAPADLKCLIAPNYLNDNIVDIYLNYILSKIPCELAEKIHLFSAAFYFICKSTDYNKENQRRRIARWTRKFDIFSKNFIVIPVCANEHWILIIVCNYDNAIFFNYESKTFEDKDNGEPEESSIQHDENSQKSPCILIFNSFCNLKDTEIHERMICGYIQKYLQNTYIEKKKATEMECQSELLNTNICIKRVECPQQENLFDCGLFILQYMLSFFENPMISELFHPRLDFKKCITRNQVIQDLLDLDC